ncbi:MAG: HEAT repeat domain-containing protein [Verrucomicrobia bacterium]|nr:HEAT repeat domain-containing protein [Verrucomicrobiota bacterium]
MKTIRSKTLRSTVIVVAGFGLALAALGAREMRPVPDGAQVALVFASGTSFLLGDVIEFTFILSNAGPRSLEFETGGDYRGTGFPTRYRFTVIDENRRALPKETWMEMGGLAGPSKLEPGEVHRQLLRLQNYVRVDRPGVFSVQVAHDFGWTATQDRPLPVARATIAISIPTAEQAAERVRLVAASQEPIEENQLGAYWHKTDFRYLSHPVFLSALERQAGLGEARALEGVQRIQTTNATWALIRLLSSENPVVLHGAALFLGQRMPPRIVGGYPRRPFGYVAEEAAAAYTNQWLPEAAEPLRIAASRLLRSTNTNHARTGAFIIESIGRTEDAVPVLEALRKTLEQWSLREKPEDNILNAPGAGDALMAALGGLRERGYRAPRNGGIEVIMAQFLEWADPTMPRGDGWEQTLEAFFTQNPPMLREAAVRALPKPPAGKWEKLLLEALDDRDRGVIREACRAAGASESAIFIVPLANIVRTERHVWVVREASQALTKLGAHWAATDAWIERVADEELWHDSMAFLVEKLEHPKPGGGTSGNRPSREERVALRQKWQRFFSDKERQELVQSGRPVPVTEDEARDLLGGAFRIWLEGDKTWPPEKR